MTEPQKTSEPSESTKEEEKPGDTPPEQKRKEAERREGKTFGGRGKEIRK